MKGTNAGKWKIYIKMWIMWFYTGVLRKIKTNLLKFSQSVSYEESLKKYKENFRRWYKTSLLFVSWKNTSIELWHWLIKLVINRVP